jgi:hypothetical protein
MPTPTPVQQILLVLAPLVGLLDAKDIARLAATCRILWATTRVEDVFWQPQEDERGRECFVNALTRQTMVAREGSLTHGALVRLMSAKLMQSTVTMLHFLAAGDGTSRVTNAVAPTSSSTVTVTSPPAEGSNVRRQRRELQRLDARVAQLEHELEQARRALRHKPKRGQKQGTKVQERPAATELDDVLQSHNPERESKTAGGMPRQQHSHVRKEECTTFIRKVFSGRLADAHTASTKQRLNNDHSTDLPAPTSPTSASGSRTPSPSNARTGVLWHSDPPAANVAAVTTPKASPVRSAEYIKTMVSRLYTEDLCNASVVSIASPHHLLTGASGPGVEVRRSIDAGDALHVRVCIRARAHTRQGRWRMCGRTGTLVRIRVARFSKRRCCCHGRTRPSRRLRIPLVLLLLGAQNYQDPRYKAQMDEYRRTFKPSPPPKKPMTYT